MHQTELNQKAQAAAERAAINDAKQKILFRWHQEHRPTNFFLPCKAVDFLVYQKAADELMEQHPSCFFGLTKLY